MFAGSKIQTRADDEAEKSVSIRVKMMFDRMTDGANEAAEFQQGRQKESQSHADYRLNTRCKLNCHP